MPPILGFSSIWVIVVAVRVQAGERPQPIALAAKEVCSNDIIEMGTPRLLDVKSPPYPTGPQALVVTINGQEVASFHLAMGWRLPERLIDVMVEFRNCRGPDSGMRVGGLAGALMWFGQPAGDGLVAGTTPEPMRRRLAALASLFEAMCTTLDLGRAMLRGRSFCAVARIEMSGIPLDRQMLAKLREHWPAVRARVVDLVDGSYGVYRDHGFRAEAFAAWLARQGIDWPVAYSGSLDLSDETFREMARRYPEIRPLKELRTTLIGFDPGALTVGRDGRNRTPLRPFSSITGRNQPSARASVLGNAAWVRHLIRPAPRRGLAMIDWQQQEFGIAAALSGDGAMQSAYLSGDPYMALAIAAQAAPAGATTTSHGDVRERFKRCALGLQYGVGPRRLAHQLGTTESVAAEMIAAHKSAFPTFWRWTDAVELRALMDRELRSVFGWRLPVNAESNPRSIRNFLMQANGAEALRLACCLVTEAGILVCAPNHDALLIEAPARELPDAIATTQRLMAEASEIVLDGFTLRTSVKTVTAPDRWRDPRGHAVWSAVAATMGLDEPPAHQCHAT